MVRVCFPGVVLLFLLIVSCKSREQRYVSELKENLPVFDSISQAIIDKYSAMVDSAEQRFDIFTGPEHDRLQDRKAYDAGLKDFFKRFHISSVTVLFDSTGIEDPAYKLIYVRDDFSTYQYSSAGFPSRDTAFENTRILVRPVNKHWKFEYEKPNW
jgi:hypothetical protein